MYGAFGNPICALSGSVKGPEDSGAGEPHANISALTMRENRETLLPISQAVRSGGGCGGCSRKMYLAQSLTWRAPKWVEMLQVWEKSKTLSSPVDLGPRCSK